jgi:hypothetical protein
MVLFSAQDESHRWVFPRQHPVLPCIIQIQVHLTGIRVREFAELEVDDDEASESAVDKQQINTAPLVPNTQSVLAPDKGEIASELKEENLEFAKQSVLGFLKTCLLTRGTPVHTDP